MRGGNVGLAILLALGACAPEARSPPSQVSARAPTVPPTLPSVPLATRTAEELLSSCSVTCPPLNEAEKDVLRAYANDGTAQLASTPVDQRGSMDVLAFRVAAAYELSGDFAGARTTYARFVNEDASEPQLELLEHGDPRRRIAPDAAAYARRVERLSLSLDELATWYFVTFDYLECAEVYETIARNRRLPPQKRAEAARNALLLFTTLGLPARAAVAHQVALALGPPPDERAALDYFLASLELHLWSASAPDEGENRKHRIAAEAALVAYHAKNRANPVAAKYALEAAWRVAELKKAVGDAARAEWLTKVVDAWQLFNAQSGEESKAAPYVDYGAMAAYELLDADIHARFDGRSARCAGKNVLQLFGIRNRAAPPVGLYMTLASDVDAFDAQLAQLSVTYPSAQASGLVAARRGSLYDEACVCLDLSGLPPSSTVQEMVATASIAIRYYAVAIEPPSDPGAPAISRAVRRLAYLRAKIGQSRLAASVGSTNSTLVNPGLLVPNGLPATSPMSLTILPAPEPWIE